MRSSGPAGNPRGFVTTSWDDGGADDLRIAEALAKRGLLGTFYWPLLADDPRYGRPDAVAASTLLDMGMEIGSHTLTHPILTTVDAPTLECEVSGSKERLEQLTGREVVSFCYPAGFNNRTVRDAVKTAGYRLGRTTMGFRTSLDFDPFAMPVTAQVYPHSRRVHITHSIRKRNLSGLAAWLGTFRGATDIASIVDVGIARVEQAGGVLHLWGHGWEIEALGFWPQLEALLDRLADHQRLHPATNSGLLGALP